MKPTTLWRLMALAGLSSAIATSAQAQQNDKYWYGGFAAGSSLSQMNEVDTTRSLIGPAPTFTGFGHDERDAAGKIFGGYQFNRNIGVEFGYFNLGTFNFTSLTTAPYGILNGAYKVDGWNLDLVGTMPLGERWSALARIGAQYAKTNGSFNQTGPFSTTSFNRDQSETNAKVGLGLQYEISKSVLLRGEVERYRLNDGLGNHGGVNTYTIGLVFPFGRQAAPAPRPVAMVQAPAPAPAPYVAPPPPPPPPPAPIPAPQPRRVTFSASELFDFDKAVVKADGRSALDKFAQDLRGTNYDTVSVEGHTDRIGSDAYNQKLSERRALAVKDYLVSSGGVPAAKIASSGKGEANPVTKPEDCPKGNKATAKLVACLAPDRRVEVIVTGTK